MCFLPLNACIPNAAAIWMTVTCASFVALWCPPPPHYHHPHRPLHRCLVSMQREDQCVSTVHALLLLQVSSSVRCRAAPFQIRGRVDDFRSNDGEVRPHAAEGRLGSERSNLRETQTDSDKRKKPENSLLTPGQLQTRKLHHNSRVFLLRGAPTC